MNNNEIEISQSDSGIRLERFFQKQLPQVPRAVRQKFFRKKKLAIFRKNGENIQEEELEACDFVPVLDGVQK